MLPKQWSATEIPRYRRDLVAALEALAHSDEQLAALDARAASRAELFWVTPDMTAAAWDASVDLPDWIPADAAPCDMMMQQPGVGASRTITLAGGSGRSWTRQERSVVLVDLRPPPDRSTTTVDTAAGGSLGRDHQLDAGGCGQRGQLPDVAVPQLRVDQRTDVRQIEGHRAALAGHHDSIDDLGQHVGLGVGQRGVTHAFPGVFDACAMAPPEDARQRGECIRQVLAADVSGSDATGERRKRWIRHHGRHQILVQSPLPQHISRAESVPALVGHRVGVRG